MSIYAPSSRQASRPAPHTSSAARRAAFAKDAVFAEFPARAARALNQADFKDHRPDRGPRPLGKIAAKVADNTGLKAIRFWRDQASRADSTEERAAALRIAAEIARLANIDIDLPELDAAR